MQYEYLIYEIIHKKIFLKFFVLFEKILKRFGMHDCQPRDTPVAKGDKFSLNQCPKNNFEIQEMQQIPYASATEV